VISDQCSAISGKKIGRIRQINRICLIGQVLLCGSAIAAAPDAQSGMIGWRTDTTGRYPDATPPLNWSPTKNVAWATNMPGQSASTPIIVGEKIFTMADPYWLVCVNKEDGKVLWKKSNDIKDVIEPGGMDAYKERCTKWFEAYETKLKLEIERVKIGEKLMDMPRDDTNLVARVEEIGREIKKHDHDMSRLPQFALGSKKGGWHLGFTCATPVSEGKTVFALFGNGVGAMYDLDGNLKWARFLRHRTKGYGQSQSPARIGDIIGIAFDDEFFALDAKTGKTLWIDYELQHQGSPVGINIGELQCFITNDGNVRKASDGTKLSRLGLMRFHTPMVEKDGTVWYVPNDSVLAATKLMPDGKGGVTKKGAGGGPAPGKIYWSTPVIHDGYAYMWEGDENMVYVTDLKTRQIIFQQKLGLGAAYVSPTAAGRFVFVAGQGGTTCVLERGWKRTELGPGKSRIDPVIKIIARNRTDGFWACPVFEGDRMYLRTFKTLYCFQATEADKKKAAQVIKKPEKKKSMDEEFDDILDDM